LGSAIAQSENIYRTDANFLAGIKVYEHGRERINAWAGGHNNPQFATADLNKDGLGDLVVLESGRGLKVYINHGTPGTPRYIYTPEFTYRFPKVYRYFGLVDFNCDTVPDIIYGEMDGYASSMIGYYDATDNTLNFKDYRKVNVREGNSLPYRVFVPDTDLACFIDLDNDGDIDMLKHDASGVSILAIYSMRVEQGLPCDSLGWKLKDRCWGKFQQNVPREHDLGIQCSNIGLRITPQEEANANEGPYSNARINKVTDGSNSLCLFDADGDGDLDVLTGNVKYADIQYIENGKVDYSYVRDSMIGQDTMWNKDDVKVYMPTRPAAFWLDIDQDGDRDIIISPHQELTENYKSAAFYKNTGTNTTPVFKYTTDTFLVETMMDHGGRTYPVLYDYDKDGLQDLLVGTIGKFIPTTGKYANRIIYYRNSGTATAPEFTLADANLLNISVHNFNGAAITVGDIDNDGKDDLLLGKEDGTIAMFRNMAISNAVTPDWQLLHVNLMDENGAMIQWGNMAVPCLHDVDRDPAYPNSKDLIIGSSSGVLVMYHNVGAPGQIKLKWETSFWGEVDVKFHSAPFIGKIDNTGKDYLLIGSSENGAMYRYDGFIGNTTTPFTLKDTRYSDIYVKGKFAVPFVTDINGDGKYDMFIGNDLGGVELYRQVWNVNVKEIEKDKTALHLYPNPASNMLQVELTGKNVNGAAITIYNSMGQVINNITAQPYGNAAQIDISHLVNGVYICNVYVDGEKYSAIFSKQ
jgi:FG-GAP repeat.